MPDRQIEDIFAGSESDGNDVPQLDVMPRPTDALQQPQAQLQQQIEPTLQPAPEELSYQRVGRGSKIRLLMYGAGVLLLALILAGVWWWRSNSSSTPRTTTTSNINQVVPVNTPTEEANTNAEAAQPARRIDSDGDGLLDTEEEELGTNAASTDTDGDGLNDRQEVQIYKTDPSNPDTDGDGFNDGAEVRGFYNPNGSGKLLDTVTEIDKSEDSQ